MSSPAAHCLLPELVSVLGQQGIRRLLLALALLCLLLPTGCERAAPPTLAPRPAAGPSPATRPSARKQPRPAARRSPAPSARRKASKRRGSARKARVPDADLGAANVALHRAIDERRSDFWLNGQGRLIKALPDDTHGSQHQRLLLAIGKGRTLLIAHNIDLAPRVPITRGQLLRFRGEFEFNAKGGVVHWTHHDPGGRRKGGWLELDGKRYR